MHTYVTPEKLNRFNPEIPDIRFKCQTHKGTFFHCVWEYEVIKTFWQKVTVLISSIISNPIPMTPKICALDLIPFYHYQVITLK